MKLKQTAWHVALVSSTKVCALCNRMSDSDHHLHQQFYMNQVKYVFGKKQIPVGPNSS